MKNTFIYTISDEIGNIRYIGKSNNPKNRLYKHLVERANKHKYNWLNAIIKRGFYPIVEIIDEVPEDSWQIMEQYWISQFKEWGFNLLNLTEGGEGGSGYKHSLESRKKMQRAKLGKKLSEEHKKKISKSVEEKSKNDPNYNKCEDKEIFLDKDELYQKYIVENLSIPNLTNYLNVSETTIFRNLKEYNIKKDKSVWIEQMAAPKKVVLQYDLNGNLIKEWESVIDIKNTLNIKPDKCCRGEAKSASGFIWRYKDEWFDLGIDNLPNISKKLYQYDLTGKLVNEFKSGREANRKTKIGKTLIWKCTSGIYESAGGFIWKYK